MGNDVEELRGRLARLETLHRVAAQVHSTLDLREAFAFVLGEAIRLLQGSSGSVCLLNPTTGFLEIEASQGLPESARDVRLRFGEGLTGWVARTGRSVRVGDVDHDARYVAIRPNVRSELAVPLRLGEEVRGVLNVDSDREGGFSESDQQILEDLAALLAPAIQNIWLYESARQRARLLESLLRVGQIINSTLSRDEALTVITREARVLMRARMCSLLMVDESGQWLDVVAHNGAGPAYTSKPRLALAESLLGIVVRRRKPIQVENVQVSGRYQQVGVARLEGLVSLLAVLLRYGEGAIGTLNVYTGEPHIFSNEEVHTLTTYAELSALALEKARLYERMVAVEEQLRQSERLSALGLLAAEIAHEIRNPLTVMKMLHHSLDLQFEEADPRRTDVRILGEKMDHMNRIVDRVLDFARRTEPAFGEVDVNQLLDDLSLLTRHKLNAQGVTLERRLHPALPKVRGDSTQLEQVFLNLTLNALEAMPQGGRLIIRSRALSLGDSERQPSHVVVRFRDTGVGMTKEQSDRVFTSLLSSSKPKGTGLGLAIVARVIEQHQGSVRMFSRIGHGTAFTIVLPVAT